MKKLSIFLLLVYLVIFFSCQKEENDGVLNSEKSIDKEDIAAIAQELENKLDSAIKHLSQGNIAEGTGLLLDGILLVKPGEDWPEGFKDLVLSAKRQYQKGDLFEGGKMISKALGLVHPPKANPDKETKQSISHTDQELNKEAVAPIAGILRDKILSAKEDFKNGKVNIGVVSLLEGLLLLAPYILQDSPPQDRPHHSSTSDR